MDKNEKIFMYLLWSFLVWFIVMTLFVWESPKLKYWVEEVEETIQPQVEEDDEEIRKDEHKPEKKKRQKKNDKVTVTVYNPVVNQCDSTPLITADNSKIDLKKLKQGKLKWVAVSRDLLKNGKVKYGERIRIKCKGDPTLSGIYTVHDTMNPRWRNRIDILAHQEVRTTGKYNEVTVEFLGL